MKTQNTFLNILFYLSVLLFFLGFNFTDNPPSGWYLQTLPNLNGKTISDVFFLDSLTGWAASGTNSGPGNINYILKTTNGGDNWLVMFYDTCFFSRINFIDNIVGYASGGSGGGTAYIYKTTNGGINWNRLWNMGASEFDDMIVLNEDTIWVVDHDGLTGGVFRTTNGGLNWTQQLSAGSQNPDKIYMYSARIGFICKSSSNAYFRKTTDGGSSWFTILQNEAFSDIYFIDSLSGWRCWTPDTLKKTTNGGLNWINYLLPPTSNNFGSSVILKLSVLNKDTIWGAGPIKYNTINGARGMLYITTNGGLNWGYQLPNPNLNIYRYYFINFTNKNNGWAYSVINGIHTTTGGDTTIFTAVIQTNTEIPKDYILYQNYPNPFNPKTTIEYEIKRSGFITLAVYDIRGKEMMTLVSQKQTPGKYLVDFPGVLFPSGIYFYRLSTDGKPIATKKMMLIK